MNKKRYIRNAEYKDIKYISNIYLDNIDSFQSRLGKKFNMLLYKNLLKYGLGFVYVITKEKKENIAGFILGIKNKKGLISPKLAFLLLLNLIKKPLIFFDIIKIIFDKNEHKPELYSIAIKKEYQRKGIGKQLTLKLLKEFKKRKINIVYVKVASSSPANEFYKKMGFKLFKIINRNPPLNMYKISLIDKSKKIDNYYTGLKGIYFYKILKKIIQIGNLKKDKKILDFGCGFGKLKKILGNKVINYDIIPEFSEVKDWKKVKFDTLVANEVFYLFSEKQLSNFLKNLYKHNPEVELIVGISKQNFLNKLASFLFKKDAYDNTLLKPKEELGILTKYMKILDKKNVFFMCDVYLLKFKDDIQ